MFAIILQQTHTALSFPRRDSQEREWKPETAEVRRRRRRRAYTQHTFIESRSWQMTNTWFDETTMKKLLYIVPWSWLETAWANLAVILDPPRDETRQKVFHEKKRANFLRNSKLFLRLEQLHVSLVLREYFTTRSIEKWRGKGKEWIVIKKSKPFRSNSFRSSLLLFCSFSIFSFLLVFVFLEKHKDREDARNRR